MKRTTYLVTIAREDGTTTAWIEEKLRTSNRDSIEVADITATHAKEKEVIKAALAQLEACERNNRWIDSTTDTEDKARELRALMEKQP